MHEHLDEMGLVHMNGRIYDPLIGRFMSADPIIQAPGMLQSYNRYAYVMNNPLNLTDPSGFSWWTRFRDKILKPVVFAYVGYLTGGLISNALITGASTGFAVGANGLSTAFVTLGGSAGSLTTLGGVLAGAGGGFVAGALSSGTLDGGLRGALTGGVFGGIGATGAANGWGAGQYVAAHAAGGCITSVASGGACGSGAASAAFGKFTTIAIGDVQGDFAKGVASTVAGGVGSVIAGGKFENGAVTAAYGYLFNGLLTELTRPTIKQLTVAVGVLATIKASFDTDGIYDEGHKAGEAFAQKQADASATALARIEKNEDAFATQKSAYQVSKIYNCLEVAVTLGSSLGDRNPVKSYYFVQGFNRGYTDCVCVGVSRDK
jgi:RHS repeat-associated protein